MQFDTDIDTSGMQCPMPILKAKKALSAMQGGQVLRVTTTDPGAERDFQAFARQTGNALLGQEPQDNSMGTNQRRKDRCRVGIIAKKKAPRA